MRRLVIAVAALVVLVAANVGIYQREQLLASGRTVMLELAPVDPRSLMQGDYMALRFRVAVDAFAGEPEPAARDGHLVLVVDPNQVGEFRRIDNGEPLGADEIRMRFRMRDGTPKFATNAFFFQEGDAPHYESARYGEFRVSPDGDALLVAMRGPALETLGPASTPR